MPFPLLEAKHALDGETAADALLEAFLGYVEAKGLELYAAQEEAILEIFDGKNVLLKTPTGSGKSLVAAAMHFRGLCLGRRSVYTCPIKALVNEKFLALCNDFGADQVGMSTGDFSINRDAPILCCTAEVLSNIALRDGADADVDDVIMDEFHYYSDVDRGVAWQAPLLTLPQCRFLLMSATMGDTHFIEKDLTRVTGAESVSVSSEERPVPLEMAYSETPLDKVVQDLVDQERVPAYLVHFTQRSCHETAQALTSLNLATKAEKAALSERLADFAFTSPFGKEIKKLLRHGLAVHHAGLLPKYRILVEQLAQQGMLKVICGTDTLGVGVNVPIRTVVFTKLCKYDGQKTALLTSRDFRQIAGRAGRRGFDDVGYVIIQAPEHVIENKRAAEKAAGDPKKQKKLKKKTPPARGYVHWDEEAFQRLRQQPPEPLVSRFQVSHGMLLNVLSRDGDGCRAMKEIIQTCHENPDTKKELRRRAFQLFRALRDKEIVGFMREPDETGRRVGVNLDLQEDFSLNQQLGLYLVDTLEQLDAEAESYPLDVLSLAEAILENPLPILIKQLDKLKEEKLAQMKAEGIEYDERIAELEKLEWPKPNREFIYDTFNAFADQHPWVGEENIQPKAIAREMFERFMPFDDYVKLYGLQRSEGLLLRHLSSVYKVLVQTVPERFRNDALEEMILYFEQTLRRVDTSLLDEWQNLRDPDRSPVASKVADAAPADALLEADITRDRKRFAQMIRNEAFHFVQAFAQGRYEDVLDLIDPGSQRDGRAWHERDLHDLREAYLQDHEHLVTDTSARAAANTVITEESDGPWSVQQVFHDPEGHNDWAAHFALDVDGARQSGKVVLRLDAIGPIGIFS